MARSITYTAIYPKPIDQAWADLCNPAFQEGKLLHAGARDPKVTITPIDKGGYTMELERQNPVVGVPGAVKKITGEWQHVIERLTWSPGRADGTRTADISVDFVGIPLAMSGLLTLAPQEAVTTLTLACEFKSSIPLVGGKLESTAAEQTAMSMDSEAEFMGGFAG